MLLKSSATTVKLSKRYLKILFLSTALHDSYVFLAMPAPGRQVLVHCDSTGKTLFEHLFEHPVDSLGMLSEREAAVLDTRANCIALLDLQTHKFTFHPHQFCREESDLADIETFYESRLMCVKESGLYNDNRFFLTYYSYPLGGKAVARYESSEDEWTHQYISRKGNNHSMVAWFKPRNDEQIEIKTFDLRDDPKGQYRHYRIRNSIGDPYGMNKVELAIINLWEARRNVFCAVCLSNKTESRAVNKEGVVNNNFMIDVVASTVREAEFFFDSKYNDFLIDYYYLGPISMFRTFYFQDGKVERTPVYYVNNQTEKIVATEDWECTYRTKYFIPGFDASTLIEAEYENAEIDEFTVSLKKIIDLREISLHFLLHINEDFDDDLLQDAIDLLHSSEY